MLTTLLRSLRDMHGYRVLAIDGPVGRVNDFIANDGDWTVRYIVVNLEDSASGRKVLISPYWIDAIESGKFEIRVHSDRHTIGESPEYDFSSPVSREYEEELHAHYGKPKYWT